VRRLRTVVATEILLVLGLVGFVGIAHLVERVYKLDYAVRLSPAAAVVFAAAPALIWLAVFHLQDRRDDHPKLHMLGMYLLGAFVAGPLADFAVSQAIAQPVVPTPQLGILSTEGVLRAVLVVGLAQELCKYVVVRYTVYPSPHLDDPIDGIIYMTAVGLGFATYVNFDQLSRLDNNIYLTVGAGMVISTTLLHVVLAGVVGYALGKAKFRCVTSNQRSTALILGLCAAMVLNGQFNLLSRIVTATGSQATPWYGVAYAGGFAAAVFLVISLLMRNQLQEPDDDVD